MSGFGLRALKKKSNDENDQKKNKLFYKHIVIGENIYGILTFLKLFQKYPGEVKFITKDSYLKSDFTHDLELSLNAIRSKEVADCLSGLNPRLEIFQINEPVKFYKDTKFQPFGGRAKSHEIPKSEEFFQDQFYHFSKNAIIETEEYEKLDELLIANQIHKIINKIELTKPIDLVDQENFVISTGENDSIGCEKLYFCESPKRFYQLVSNKNELSESLHSFCAPISSEKAIVVNFKTAANTYDGEGTIFIPQSMTHEWGSFVLDIKKFDPVKNEQEIMGLTFLGDDDLQEEDLAKKIKLMRKVIERVLPNFTESNTTQKIKFYNEYLINDINDGLSKDLVSENVRFYGHGAPIDHEMASKFKYFSRAYYAIMTNEC